MIPNYELKAQVLNNGCVANVRKLEKAKFLKSMYDTFGDYDALCKGLTLEKNTDVSLYSDAEILESHRVLSSNYKRVKRLDRRIKSYLLLYPCTFITLTFKDSYLKRTSSDTRRQKVFRFLKSLGVPYVANIDFGSNKEYKDKKGDIKKATKREHYHALICSQTIDYTPWHDIGAIKGEKVAFSNNLDAIESLDSLKLAKYISKLTNHAIKESCKGNRIIYSRESSNIDLKAKKVLEDAIMFNALI